MYDCDPWTSVSSGSVETVVTIVNPAVPNRRFPLRKRSPPRPPRYCVNSCCAARYSVQTGAASARTWFPTLKSKLLTSFGWSGKVVKYFFYFRDIQNTSTRGWGGWEAKMSFAKASVKRFNEDLNDAPAPNAYDAKKPEKKVSTVSLAKDNLPRFQEPKVVIYYQWTMSLKGTLDFRMSVLALGSTWPLRPTPWASSPRVGSSCVLHPSGCTLHCIMYTTVHSVVSVPSDWTSWDNS